MDDDVDEHAGEEDEKTIDSDESFERRELGLDSISLAESEEAHDDLPPRRGFQAKLAAKFKKIDKEFGKAAKTKPRKRSMKAEESEDIGEETASPVKRKRAKGTKRLDEHLDLKTLARLDKQLAGLGEKTKKPAKRKRGRATKPSAEDIDLRTLARSEPPRERRGAKQKKGVVWRDEISSGSDESRQGREQKLWQALEGTTQRSERLNPKSSELADEGDTDGKTAHLDEASAKSHESMGHTAPNIDDGKDDWELRINKFLEGLDRDQQAADKKLDDDLALLSANAPSREASAQHQAAGKAKAESDLESFRLRSSRAEPSEQSSGSFSYLSDMLVEQLPKAGQHGTYATRAAPCYLDALLLLAFAIIFMKLRNIQPHARTTDAPLIQT
eukprot:gnl/TRDRNA2_/TRDRNA2_148682_c0_seq1.p1 gnl/TRDRNA2_/TRDRNA2_148682_c0~~gnl/TRDRNA2_/TRDRNA2_148682_c0_seq1.p1  ORF type:complete len:432 (-),score=88.54 gnl/TRDRNA2_/TRDRNA2_148682_c0_seq1:98-1258(-)